MMIKYNMYSHARDEERNLFSSVSMLATEFMFTQQLTLLTDVKNHSNLFFYHLFVSWLHRLNVRMCPYVCFAPASRIPV